MCDMSLSTVLSCVLDFFLFRRKTAYELRISDWCSDVCSSDLQERAREPLESPECRYAAAEAISHRTASIPSVGNPAPFRAAHRFRPRALLPSSLLPQYECATETPPGRGRTPGPAVAAIELEGRPAPSPSNNGAGL